MKTKGLRRKRMAAFLLDLAALCLPNVLLGTLFLHLWPFLGMAVSLLVAVTAVAGLVGMLLRDYLFHGPGFGKRVFRLRLVDAYTHTDPSAKQAIVKNVCVFLFPVDGLVLFLTGKSLGERLSDTQVIHDPCFGKRSVWDATAKRRVRAATIVVVCIAVLLFAVIFVSMEIVKTKEHYRVAHTYFMSKVNTEGAPIVLTKYDGSNTNAAFTFLVRGHTYTVVCHSDDSGWFVCRDCTAF